MSESGRAADPALVVPPGTAFELRRATAEDAEWIRGVLRRYWASEQILTRGRLLDGMRLPAFVARDGEEPVGLITYNIEGDACEIVTHNSFTDSGGVGSCLLAAVRTEAREQGCRRLWLVTTNDNTPALRFYQRRDFDVCALHRNAVVEGRKLKPVVPDQGLSGIPVRHEFELEYLL